MTWLSLRNAPEVHIARRRPAQHLRRAGSATTSSSPRAPTTRSSAAPPPRALRSRWSRRPRPCETSRPRPTTKAEVEAKADVEAEAKPELPKGAKAPLKSGGAPKGYEVKGNADSGLFHEPDGQWYDATVAEFYFKTADDAEAAGFTRAGGVHDDEEDDQ